MEVLAINRDFKMQLSERQPERQRTIGFISKTTTFHVHYACLYILCPCLQDCHLKMPNFAFYRLRKQAKANFISLSELGYGPKEFNSSGVKG